MKIYDISMKISAGMPVYRNRDSKRPVFKVESDYSTGSVYESRVDFNMHTGTHIDAPLHILKNGKTVDGIDLSRVITKCKVFDFKNAGDKITKKHLEGKDIKKGDFILLKTGNSFVEGFHNEFVYLDTSGAEYLKEKGVIGVGIDALGIERSQPGHETHKILLGSDIVILEGLGLSQVEEGEYLLFAAPLNIIGAEASPARAVLVSELV